MFPQNLQVTGGRLVYAPNSDNPDHWLVQFIAFLSPGGLIPPYNLTTRLDTSRRIAIAPLTVGEIASLPSPTQPGVEQNVPVEGSLIDVRIGAEGKIIGLWSRWRPYEEIKSVKRLQPPQQTNTDNKIQTHLFYKLEDQDDPQQFIAPCYMVSNEDSIEILPASQYSLIVDITSIDYAERVELRALVLGYAGPLRVRVELLEDRHGFIKWI